MRVNLPIALKPKGCSTLFRLGNKYDGGYVVSKTDVDNSTGLISCGISDDWSFEHDFYNKRPVPILAFDGSLTKRFWFKQVLSSLFHLNFLGVFTFFRQFLFFKGPKKLVKDFVGYDHVQNFTSVESIFKEARVTDLGKLFLKIDIEGWEYRVLPDLIKNSNSITGAVIEFHDVDLHLSRILEFIEIFPLNLVHVHANNFASTSPSGLPLVIELTFSNCISSKTDNTLPHKLDNPNNRKAPEYVIEFTEIALH